MKTLIITCGSALNKGYTFLDKSTDKIVCISNDSLPNSFIHSLLISRDSTLWVGTQVGLLKYNRQTGSFFQYKNRPNDETSIAGNSIHALLEDKSGDIWVGTFDNGICRFDVKKQRFYQYPEVTVLNRTNFYCKTQLKTFGYATGVMVYPK